MEATPWHESHPHPAPTSHHWLREVGNLFWLRTHISIFLLSAVVLLAGDMLLANGNIIADLFIELWAMLIAVHLVIVAISRLVLELLTPEPRSRVVAPRPTIVQALPAQPPAAPAAGPEPTPAPPPDQTSDAHQAWIDASYDLWLTRAYPEPEPPAPTGETTPPNEPPA